MMAPVAAYESDTNLMGVSIAGSAWLAPSRAPERKFRGFVLPLITSAWAYYCGGRCIQRAKT